MRDTCGIHVSAEVTMRGNQDTCWIHARYIITCYIHAGYVYMYRSENVSMASSCAARAWKRVVCVTSEACCVNVHTSFSWRPTALAPQLFRDWLFTPPVSRFTVNKKAQIFPRARAGSPLLLWRDEKPGPHDFSPQSFSPPSSFAPPHGAVRVRVDLRVDCLNGGGGFLGYVVSPPLWLAAQRTCTA
jgi:hypothetical protein